MVVQGLHHGGARLMPRQCTVTAFRSLSHNQNYEKTLPQFWCVRRSVAEICLQRPGFNRVKDEDRFWMKNPYESRTIDYTFDANEAPRKGEEHLPAAPDSNDAESSSDEENKPDTGDDEDEHGEEKRGNGNSSDSSTPCPINCYGCGLISDGDDDLQEVQCSICGFWSHFRRQPAEDGEVDWSDPQVVFTCQGCRPRPATLFSPREIVMLPDPFIDGDWRSEDIMWYPARFRKHHLHTRDPKNEFEFVYLDCVDWAKLTLDDYMFQPSTHCKHDRASCEAMLKFEPKQEDLGRKIPHEHEHNRGNSNDANKTMISTFQHHFQALVTFSTVHMGALRSNPTILARFHLLGPLLSVPR
ncbi:hypothetical protein C8F04DRAFT_1243223 [Mycena alexandri]|uniref:Uncharacterized protein n=1 Tax=Mycena alexandri TaxID=1745969 RepID=A0AAD6WMZ0_9AGAR|nr:hypothetical protein C8F04DRAFT_1243223 [Mycena alexandri]